MSDSAAPIKLDPEIERFICMEIARQIHPVAVQMESLMAENETQTASLGKITRWMHEFYGNGSGKKGVFEKRIEADDERYAQLLAWKTQAELDKARKEGEAQGIEKMAAAGHERAKSGRDWTLILATGLPTLGLVIIELFRK